MKPSARLTIVDSKLPALTIGVAARGRKKSPGELYRRTTLTMLPAVDDTLRRIASARFQGNISQAAAWCIVAGAAALEGPLADLGTPPDPRLVGAKTSLTIR